MTALSRVRAALAAGERPSDDDVRDRIYRVQDAEGRGPFRPGLPKYWIEDRESYPPSFIEWFGDPRPHIRRGEHVGCGCRSLVQLGRWFRQSELQTLHSFGFQVVQLRADRIIGESPNEVIFARRKPLHIAVEPIAIDAAIREPK